MNLIWRRIVAGCVALGLAGAIYVAYQRHLKETVVRIAVVSTAGQDAVLLTALDRWLAENGRRITLRLVPSGSEAQSLELLRTKKVEAASARADSVSGQGIASMMVLYREIAVLLAPQGSPVTTWRDLNRRTLGVTLGTSHQDPLLQSLLKANGVDDSLMVSVAPENVRSELQKRAILATAFVTPVPGDNLRHMRRLGSLRDARGALSVLEVPDAEALASRDKRYSAITIAAGVLRPNPPLPEEGTETLAVARHLMTREATSSLATTRLVRELLEATRALQLSHPLLSQAGAPDIEADAFVRVHAGPKALFNGEDRGLLALFLEWIYIVPLVVGGLASAGVWFHRWVSPHKVYDAEELIRSAMELRRLAASATSTAELTKLRTRFEHVVGQFESDIATLDARDCGAVLSALNLCDRRLDTRRAELESVIQRTGKSL